MEFMFSTILEGVTLNIHSTTNYIQRLPLINEMPHKHFYIEFHYVYKGEEKIIFPKLSREITLNEGELALIPESTYHKTETSPAKDMERFCFNFSVDADENSTNELVKIYQSVTDYKVISNKSVSLLMERCRTIISENPTPLEHTSEGIILLDAVLEVFKTLYNTKKPPLKRQLNKQYQKWLIEEYISNFYSFSDGIAGLASKLYLSERQTRRIVKQLFGEEYKALIIMRRIETAQILLTTSKLSLEEIGEKIGYKSYSGFHMAFTKALGITPGDYRKNSCTDNKAKV